ncbi:MULTISPECIES: hypothetical protein [unclassified Streptomyces]|nr:MULTISPECIES: hypothetical protein [unclassified Streptomyces]MCY0923576.1 hypothetical protein [Streptomyces sp. H27-G5]MCY0962025.1 hypothetical protein [Streptomyces sp. H27-H5]
MTNTAVFRLAHPGPVTDWDEATIEGYLNAADADAAESTTADEEPRR